MQMEELLKLLAVLHGLGAHSETKAYGGAYPVPVVSRPTSDTSPAAAAVRHFLATSNAQVLQAEVLATVVILPEAIVQMATFDTLACDMLWNLEQSDRGVRGGVIKGYTRAGVCKTLGVVVTNHESAAVWAWAFSVLHLRSLQAGTGGCVASSLLHDCVQSTFVAAACVLPSLKEHHFCSWHVIAAFQEKLDRVYLAAEDLVEPALIAAVQNSTMTLPAALKAQRTVVFHSFNAVILSCDADAAAALLEGFVLRYCRNRRLRAVLSKAPYCDLSAVLNSLCTTRAIDANCELFARSVRSFQRTSTGARSRMQNFAAALQLLVTTLYDSARSELEEALRLDTSNKRRLPLGIAAGAADAPAQGLPHSSSPPPLVSLLACPLGAAAAASVSFKSLAMLPSARVKAAAEHVALAIPKSSYAQRLRLLSYCPVSCSFSLATLMQQLLDHDSRIAPLHSASHFDAALERAYQDSVLRLEGRLALVLDPAQGQAPTLALPPSCTRSSDHAAAASALKAGGGFGGAGCLSSRKRDLSELSEALQVGVGKFPPLASRMAKGQHAGAVREQASTVSACGDTLTPANKARILKAHDALPSAVVIRLAHPNFLLQRPPGVPHESAVVNVAVYAPKQRDMCSITLFCTSMRNIRPHLAEDI